MKKALKGVDMLSTGAQELDSTTSGKNFIRIRKLSHVLRIDLSETGTILNYSVRTVFVSMQKCTQNLLINIFMKVSCDAVVPHSSAR